MLSCSCNLSNGHKVLYGPRRQSFSDFVIMNEDLILGIFEVEIEVGQSYKVLIHYF